MSDHHILLYFVIPPLLNHTYFVSVPCHYSGTTMDSKWIAWRTSFLAAFILSMMVNITYGASLVSSLLSAPVKTIRTTRDLIDSSLQFAAEDISYSVPYFAVSYNALLTY
jgi:hypothetical protein